MATLQANENLWSIAHDLAYEMHERNVDINEVNKVTAFMRQYHKSDDALDKFKSLLQQLAYSNDAPIQSGRTRDYYKDIQKCCQKHLDNISDPNELLLILGWSKRLMYYYKVEPKRATEEQIPQQQQIPEPPPMQTPQLPKEPEKPKVKVPKRVNAKILKKDGFNVRVQLQTDNEEEIVFEQPYYRPKVGETVKLRVTGVNAEGKITKVVP